MNALRIHATRHAAIHAATVAPVVAGLAVLCAAWFGPLPAMAANSFVAHMVIHLSVVAVAAPLIAAGLVGMRPGTGRAPLVASVAVPASLLEFVVVWAWHVPALHGLARASTSAFVAEQVSFLTAGLLLWGSALQQRTDRGDSRGAGVAALLLTSMHMVLLGTLLALAPRPLYHGYEHALPRARDHALLVDQQLGGMLMLIGGGLPYLLGGLYLVWKLLQGPQRPIAGTAPAGTRGNQRDRGQ